MRQQAIPLIRGVTQFKRVLNSRTECAFFREVLEGPLTGGAPQLTAKPAGGEGQSALELVSTRELLAQSLLLRTINRLNRKLVAARQIQHHIAEALTLELHQKLDGVSAGPA